MPPSPADSGEEGAMNNTLQRLLSEGNFMPHGMCYLWQPDVLTLHVISDALIALAYFSIPFTLIYFTRKRADLQFHWMFICFAVFIISCGATHLMEIWVVWHPTYWLSGAIKALTALTSVPTAILLVKLVPQALRLPSPAALRKANKELEREVAERMRAQAETHQMNEQLEERVTERTLELEVTNRTLRQTQHNVMQSERLRALGQMASGIAHDINNALSPATLYAGSLLGRHLDDETREYVADIRRAVEDVAHTVARMKEFSRVREPEFEPAPVALNRILKQVVELTRARWHDMPQERGIVVQLDMNLGVDLPQVLGMESEIRDALVNLILNAVDAMPDGGTLTLRSYAEPTLQDLTPRPGVCIEVCDTGIGMTEETKHRCVEPFFTTKGERGTGLGLAMVYGMVQRHGAEIGIESEPNQGTTMRLTFPAAAAECASSELPPAPPRPVRSLKILVVDDDPRVLRSLRRVLEAEGHQVSVTAGGEAGIHAFKTATQDNEPFAVVISDLGMPYVSGRSVAAAIKAASPATSIIMVTGWGHQMRELPLHVDYLLSKPPDIEELRGVIAKLAG
jgi:signal transduction histidine kinase